MDYSIYSLSMNSASLFNSCSNGLTTCARWSKDGNFSAKTSELGRVVEFCSVDVDAIAQEECERSLR